MKQLWLTINNIITLRSFDINLYRFLYNECTVPVYRVKIDDYGWFGYVIYPDKTTKPLRIDIGVHPSKILIVTTLLHEVGHLKDNVSWKDKYDSAPTIKKEKSAWKWAIKFSQQYNLEIDYQNSIRWLGTYKAKYRRLENLAFNQLSNISK